MPGAGWIYHSPYLQWLLLRIFPTLRAWPVREWPGLIAQVNASAFDSVERVGMLAAVALVSWLLQPAASQDTALPLLFLEQLFLALPLLVLTAGPFFLRRLRRGLDQAAKKRQGSPLGQPERE